MTVREALQEILNRRGKLTPEIVVEEARNTDSPLHDRIPWDDAAAAEQYRLVVASRLIRSVKVQVTREDGEVRNVRAFVSLTNIQAASAFDDAEESDDPTGQYLAVEQVIESDILRSAWFRSLARDWQSLKRRAGDSQEFAQMVLEDIRSSTA